MVKLLDEHSDVAYRRLDVGDWDTPLAQRYLKNVPKLPYVIVYDAQGGKVDEVVGLDLAKLDATIEKSRQRVANTNVQAQPAP